MNAFTGSILLLAACSAAVAGGCSSGQPISQWKHNVEEYIAGYANSDMNALRQSPEGAEGPLRHIGMLDGSTEAQGVLLGYQRVLEKPWYIYLVGVTKKRDVVDVHMMAVSRRNVATGANTAFGFDWLGGSVDRTATQRYRQARLDTWRKNKPGPVDDKDFEMTFPAPDDVFSLTVAGNTATAIDERSGARWTLVFSNDRDD